MAVQIIYRPHCTHDRVVLADSPAGGKLGLAVISGAGGDFADAVLCGHSICLIEELDYTDEP